MAVTLWENSRVVFQTNVFPKNSILLYIDNEIYDDLHWHPLLSQCDIF